MQQAISILDEMIYRINNSNKKILPEMAYDCMIVSLEEAKSRIQALGDGWIKVTERFPDTEILALWFQWEYHIWYVSKYENDDGYFCEWEDTILDDVTHWMPLPLPPTK